MKSTRLVAICTLSVLLISVFMIQRTEAVKKSLLKHILLSKIGKQKFLLLPIPLPLPMKKPHHDHMYQPQPQNLHTSWMNPWYGSSPGINSGFYGF